jgi:mannosyltransferase OCH1-like enzyme
MEGRACVLEGPARMIPKIIHQIWTGGATPDKYKTWSETFRKHHPEWQYKFWHDGNSLDFIKDHFPSCVETYQGLANHGQKADFFRYTALCVYGGLYADIDCECRRPLDFIRAEDELILATELKTESRKVMALYLSDLKEVYCNWAFLSRPEHPVLRWLIENIQRRASERISENPILDTVKRTGPHALTAAVQAHGREKVTIVPSSYFGCCNTRNSFTLGFTYFFPTLFRKVYIRHHFETNWIDAKTKQEFIRRNLKLSASPVGGRN